MLGGPLHQSMPVEDSSALRFTVAFYVIFFKLIRHYVRDITLFNQNILSVYHIVATCVI
jgi:hypothetical protein